MPDGHAPREPPAAERAGRTPSRRANRIMAALLALLLASVLAPPALDALEPGTFDYAFGPDACGSWTECGNAAFESYQQARMILYVLFILALTTVGIACLWKRGPP